MIRDAIGRRLSPSKNAIHIFGRRPLSTAYGASSDIVSFCALTKLKIRDRRPVKMSLWCQCAFPILSQGFDHPPYAFDNIYARCPT